MEEVTGANEDDSVALASLSTDNSRDSHAGESENNTTSVQSASVHIDTLGGDVEANEEDDEEEEEEEEDEPRLKYSRMAGSVPDILSESSATCMVAADKLLVLGTSFGSVVVMDFDGNEVFRWQAHEASVCCLCVDARGEFVGSCSDDGGVVVQGLYTQEESLRLSYGRPVAAIALDPEFAVRKTQQVVLGGREGRLLLNSRGWLGAHRDHVIHSGEGAVHAINWSKGNLIAWANDRGVKVYDAVAHQRIAYIERGGTERSETGGGGGQTSNGSESNISKSSNNTRPELHRCHLRWQGDATVSASSQQQQLLIIAWGFSVKVAKVVTKSVSITAATGGGGNVEQTNSVGGTAGVLSRGSFSGGGSLQSVTHDSTTSVNNGASSSFLPTTKHMEIVGLFQTDYAILGAAPFGDLLLLLAYTESEEDDNDNDDDDRSLSISKTRFKPACRPEVKLVTWDNDEVSCDALTVQDFEKLRPSEYTLACWPNIMRPLVGDTYGVDALFGQKTALDPQCKWWEDLEEPLYYIMSPHDLIVAKLRSADDRVKWLLDRNRFEDALVVAETAGSELHSMSRRDVGCKYLDHLVSQRKFAVAASMMKDLLEGSSALWERWIFDFARLRELHTLAPHIPTSKPTLKASVYEMILRVFMTNPSDHGRFVATIQSWPRGIYSTRTVIESARQRINSGGDSALLREALAELYMMEGRRDLALGIFLQLQRPGLFGFIETHNLVPAVSDKVVLLMQLDANRATTLLLDNIDEIPPGKVVTQLSKAQIPAGIQRRLLHTYLNALYVRDSVAGAEFHELQVPLYAEFDPKKLMGFLSGSAHYPLEAAYEICESRNLVREQVYLLGRMGKSKRALGLIMEKLGDIGQAIGFVQSEQHASDDELWDALIDYSLNSPKLVGALLSEMGGRHASASHLDPIRLIKRIPPGMPVPGLRDSMTSILSDCRAELALHQSCRNMIRSDCLTLHQRLSIEARRGVLVKVVMSIIEEEQLAVQSEEEREREEKLERAFSTDSRFSDNSPIPRDSRSSTNATVVPELAQQFRSLYSYTSLPKYGSVVLNRNSLQAERQAIFFKGGKVLPYSSLQQQDAVPHGRSKQKR